MTKPKLRALILIPARGGSKRLPRKNLCRVGGTSLVARAVFRSRMFALIAEISDAVVAVSTDDDAIADEAQAWGAVAIRRPPELATDAATTEGVAAHALSRYPDCDTLVLTQCTSPLVSADDMAGMWSQYVEAPAHSRYACAQGQGAPCGAMYIAPASLVTEKKRLYDMSPVGVELARDHALDVDYAADLWMADHLSRAVLFDFPRYIIAELGCNHNGDIERALKLVDAAHAAGANAVKTQAFVPREVVAPQYAADLEPLVLDRRAHEIIAAYAKHLDMDYIVTPFDEQSVALVSDLVNRWKISSGDITHRLLLDAVKADTRPIIISTGAGSMASIAETMLDIYPHWPSLLHCVSEYPADPERMNLPRISDLRATFETGVGLSDHTTGINISLAAVARGATIIERHITLDRGLPGPDHAMSLEPGEFKRMVYSIRSIERALEEREVSMFDHADIRRSTYAARCIEAGETIGRQDVYIRRPEGECTARCAPAMLGRKATSAIQEGGEVTWQNTASA